MHMSAKKIIPALAAVVVALSGCSSAPKRPPEIFTNRNAAIGQLDLGNQSVSKGDYVNAHIFLSEAWRLALSTDDPETRIRVLLAEGNAWFNEGNRAKADETWAAALSEAEGTQDRTLMSTAKIYRARGSLAEGLGAEEVSDTERRTRAENAKAVTLAEMPNVKSNDLYLAFAWKVIGLSDKELGNAKEAVAALEKAEAIHEKARYLEDAAYDWYLVASVDSKNQNYPGARTALRKAIAFDRRAENSNGLGMDWMAVGMVEERAGNLKEAEAAYKRAGDIFRAAFLSVNAAEADRKREALRK